MQQCYPLHHHTALPIMLERKKEFIYLFITLLPYLPSFSGLKVCLSAVVFDSSSEEKHLATINFM